MLYSDAVAHLRKNMKNPDSSDELTNLAIRLLNSAADYQPKKPKLSQLDYWLAGNALLLAVRHLSDADDHPALLMLHLQELVNEITQAEVAKNREAALASRKIEIRRGDSYIRAHLDGLGRPAHIYIELTGEETEEQDEPAPPPIALSANE